MINLCHLVIAKFNDQSWWILKRHEHNRKQICALLTRKMIKKKNNIRPVSLCRKYLKYLWLKKKITRVHSSHLGHQCIIWSHISWKRGILFAYVIYVPFKWILFFKIPSIILGSCTQMHQICHNIAIFDLLL